MLLTDLFFELKNHKIKLVIVFIILAICSSILLSIGRSSYIKQTLYIDIKPLMYIDQDINFLELNNPLTTRSYFSVRYDENKFLSPAYKNRNLDLNTSKLYEKFIDEDLLNKIIKSWRPGYNILVNYDREKRRYEIILQLFNDQSIFNETFNQLLNGINNHMMKSSSRIEVEDFYKNSKSRYDRIVEMIQLYKTHTIQSIESFDNISKRYTDHSDPVLLYSKLEIIEKIIANKIRLAILTDAEKELRSIESLFLDQTNIEKYYSINSSKQTIIRRGLFPEYVIVLFLILYSGFAFGVSYFSLLRKK